MGAPYGRLQGDAPPERGTFWRGKRLQELSAAKDGLFAPLDYNRSFSHDVTTAIFVYKTMTRRPCLCTKKILWELNSFHMLKLSFIPSNLQSCWPRDWKRSIESEELTCRLDDSKQVDTWANWPVSKPFAYSSWRYFRGHVLSRKHSPCILANCFEELLTPRIKGVGMLVGNFELNP